MRMIDLKSKAVLAGVVGAIVGFFGGVYTWHVMSSNNAYVMYGFGNTYTGDFWLSELRRDLFALQMLGEKGADEYARVAEQRMRGNLIMISNNLESVVLDDIQRRTMIRLVEQSEAYASIADASDEQGIRAAEARMAILAQLDGSDQR